MADTTDTTCDSCGSSLPQQTEPVTVNGWYAGRQYVWDAAGQLIQLRRRCEQHPYDQRAEDAEMTATLDRLNDLEQDA